MNWLDKCRQIIDTESGRVLLYRDEVEAVLTAGDTISRQAAIDAVADGLKRVFVENRDVAEILLKSVPSTQSERTVYENMSDEQFEEWLYEHGICNPDIHESIPCSIVPLLIDNAINELLPQEHKIILCKDCVHWVRTCGDNQWGLGDCDVFDKHLVMCEGFCAWAERREG